MEETTMIAKYKTFLIIPCILLISATSFAADLWPMTVGMCMEFHKQDSSTPTPIEWTTIIKVADEVTINSQTYFKLKEWNYDYNPSSTDYGEFYARSTEDKLYGYDPSTGIEEIAWQIAPVGTAWNYQEELCGGIPGVYEYQFVEISSIEGITLPYGTFDEAYGFEKHEIHPCEPPYPFISPFWYEYIVPGIGYVKEVDYWLGSSPLTAPTIMELTQISDKCVVIGKNSSIGTGTVINNGVEVGDNFEIGDGGMLNKNVIVGNNFTGGNNISINKNGTICNFVEMGDDLIIDQGVAIGSFVTIGNATVIGKESIIGSANCGTASNVTIGQGVVIGQKVVVEPCAVIDELSVIPARTIVTGTCP